jgi:hypothetical protein
MACSWHLFGRGERVARSGNDGGCETHLCAAVVRVRTEEKFRRQDGSAASRMMGVGSFAEAAVVDERARIAGAAAVIAVDPVQLSAPRRTPWARPPPSIRPRATSPSGSAS